MQAPFHAFYEPYDGRAVSNDRLIGLFQTSDTNEIQLAMQAYPSSIPLLLEAQTRDEALQELRELGFTV